MATTGTSMAELSQQHRPQPSTLRAFQPSLSRGSGSSTIPRGQKIKAEGADQDASFLSSQPLRGQADADAPSQDTPTKRVKDEPGA